jgi:hypothetical protein
MAFENMDELLAQMEADETADAPLISPVNYAKVRPITPQLVYYAIRTKKLNVYICNCGGRRISMEEADDYFRAKRGSVAWPWGKERDGQNAESATPTELGADNRV